MPSFRRGINGSQGRWGNLGADRRGLRIETSREKGRGRSAQGGEQPGGGLASSWRGRLGAEVETVGGGQVREGLLGSRAVGLHLALQQNLLGARTGHWAPPRLLSQ